MNVFRLRQQLVDDYASYVRSFIRIADPRIERKVEESLRSGVLWPEPLLQVSPAFEPAEPFEQLVEQGELHPEALRIFVRKAQDGRVLGGLRLFRHQVEGLRAARAREPYVLTTGTGSGKSLSYLVPIVDDVLRRPEKGTVKAIVVYPMNALANSQEGELKKYLQHGYREPPVTFEKYTGQETEGERARILASPPDILLTNYMMLELMLTRPREAPLVQASVGLRFLVLDELHTYRGRQGADVALLVRRARDAFNSPDLLCAGTSATISTAGTWPERQREIAETATRLFGMRVQPEYVIGETLRRATRSPAEERDFEARLRTSVEAGGPSAEATLDELRENALVRWIESTVGVEPDASGRWVRKEPLPYGGQGGVVQRLHEATGVSVEPCDAALRAALHAVARPQPPDERPLFGVRLHQFFSKGDTVYASPEPEAERHITLQKQLFVPGSNRSKVLLPLSFCRECGQEYFTVRRRPREDRAGAYYEPRDIGDRQEPRAPNEKVPSPREAGFLYLSEAFPWPSDPQARIERVPDTWLDDGKIPADKEKRLPQSVMVGPDGAEQPDGVPAWFFPAPFLFCLRCGVSYDAHQLRDFGKLATLGSEGRSTATTILSLATIRRLREDPGADPRAQKLLTFTDNRQDASLQAGHFNDFAELGLLRAALAQAVRAAPGGLRHDELPGAVFQALGLPLATYAQNPDVRYARREEVERTLRESIGYRIYVDLRRGWRLTSPNLEQCGLLVVTYSDLAAFARDEGEWGTAHAALAAALPLEREDVCRVLLDYLRRELAVTVPFLDRGHQEGMCQRAYAHLQSAWALPELSTLATAAVVFPCGRPKQGRLPSNFTFLSPRGAFGAYLRRAAFASRVKKLKGKDIEQILVDLFERLSRAGYLTPKEQIDGGRIGYQANAGALLFQAGDGERAYHDPLRIPHAPGEGLKTNPFFRDFYRSDVATLRALEAREHTAQVSNERRAKREDDFREGRLPILYCSPTMELGVDIALLNVVGLRNVPPSPANYAQRSGRAGRSGQPALIFTYCSAGSPHDQFFFRNPTSMVAGAVAAPRLDLENEDLLRSHVQAVWLACAGLDLKQSLKDVLDVSGDEPSLALIPDVSAVLHDQGVRARARTVARCALRDPLSKITERGDDADGWLDRVLQEIPDRFEEACARWRGLYRTAHAEYRVQSRRAIDASRDASERESATRLRDHAFRRLSLLTEVDFKNSSDFYSYRYFATEGFLPGYSFPRLPLTAYIEGQRGKKGSEEYLSRPRFIAVSEFGPRSIVYHEGSRYTVHRVSLPIGADAGGLTIEARICDACGYLHPAEGARRADGVDLCERCGDALPAPIPSLFRMESVFTRRRDRITSDEEERQRQGYEIVTAVRFAERHGRPSVRSAVLVGEGSEPLAELLYGDAATLWRMNYGWRRRANKDALGFMLDRDQGIWAKNSDEDDDGADERTFKRAVRVVPFVEDTRNCLLITPDGSRSARELATLLYALKNAIGRRFQLEDRELAAELLPHGGAPRSLLLYEAAEGGAGVLRRLVDSPRDLREVARLALEIAHFDPNDLRDRGGAIGAPEPCDAACYDCLLSYFNQRDHSLLDRLTLPDLIGPWRAAELHGAAAESPPKEHLDALLRLAESEMERRFLRLLDERGHKLPSHAQYLVEECGTRVDFAYQKERIFLLVHGPSHDEPEAKRRDEEVSARFDDAGLTLLRFHHTEDWALRLAQYPHIFGKPISRPPPGH